MNRSERRKKTRVEVDVMSRVINALGYESTEEFLTMLEFFASEAEKKTDISVSLAPKIRAHLEAIVVALNPSAAKQFIVAENAEDGSVTLVPQKMEIDWENITINSEDSQAVTE
jgi:hypothetical protein